MRIECLNCGRRAAHNHKNDPPLGRRRCDCGRPRWRKAVACPAVAVARQARRPDSLPDPLAQMPLPPGIEAARRVVRSEAALRLGILCPVHPGAWCLGADCPDFRLEPSQYGPPGCAVPSRIGWCDVSGAPQCLGVVCPQEARHD